MLHILHSYTPRSAFHQFVEFVSRKGVETCRLAFLSRYLSVIGDGIAGVISREEGASHQFFTRMRRTAG